MIALCPGRAAPIVAATHFAQERHEAGSRMLEAGWPHHVQQMLGHADAKMTATYLNAERIGLQESMERHGSRPAWQAVR